MDTDRIEKLLEKYWICETTISEEKELKQFFQQDELPAGFTKYRHFFINNEDEEVPYLDKEFDNRILNIIDSDIQPKRKRINPILSVAASIAIILTLFFSVQLYIQANDPWQQDTFENPEEALAQVQKVLSEVKGQMNRGQDLISEKIETAEPMLSLIKK